MSSSRFRSLRQRPFLTLVGAGLLASSCSGAIDGMADDGTSPDPDATGGGGGAGGKRPPVAGAAAGSAGVTPSGGTSGPTPMGTDGAGPMPLRRLTADQYVRTVRDLLGPAAVEGLELGADTEDQETKFLITGSVSQLEVGRYRDAAAKIGENVAAQLPALLGCTPGTAAGDACIRSFVTNFGRRAYRRPLETAEIDALGAFYDKTRTDLGRTPIETARVVLQAMLQAPGFLYHWEQGGAMPARDGALVKLPPHHLASRLSYWLTNSMPDDELAKAADTNALGTPAQVEAQARRLIGSDRFRGAVETFAVQWVGARDVDEVTKDVSRFPDFAPELMSDLTGETSQLASAVLGPGGDGTLSALLTAPYTYVNSTVARLYGVTGGATRTEWKRVALDPKQRAGLFTQPAFLARKALPYAGSPVKRGHALREGVLCDRVPLAGDIVVTPPEPVKGKQTRELYVAHLTEEKCRACHSLMDPLGFAFETYDGMGKARATEEGRPVDATGEITLPSGPVKFTNAVEMLQALAKTPEVAQCFARQWFRFGVGRLEAASEEAAIAAAARASSNAGGKVTELLVKLAGSKAFTHRTLVPGETN